MPPVDRFRPAVTVAAVVEHGGRYLLVEERTPEGLRLNNPAGHLEPGESLLQAVQREALEETARAFEPQALVGVYLARPRHTGNAADITYLRFAFCGSVGDAVPGRALDQGIVRTLWLSPEQIQSNAEQHRSPLVWRCISDHLAGHRYPLALLATDVSVYAAALRS